MAEDKVEEHYYHGGDGSGSGILVIGIILIVLLILFYYFGGALRQGTGNVQPQQPSGEQINVDVPEQIDVNVDNEE